MADNKNFGDSVLHFIDKVAESGKKGFKAAGEAISDFGDKSVVRIELGQLKSKLTKAHCDLGKLVYEKLEIQKQQQVSAVDDLPVAELIDAIRKIEADIKKHEEALENAKKNKKTEEKENGATEAKEEDSIEAVVYPTEED